MTATDIVAELRGTPLRDIAAAVDGAPPEPGFYAWWAEAGAIPGLPASRHPSEPFELLYVGVAPKDAASPARLRSRLCRQHIRGNIASSTFRFGLAALLWQREGWSPCRSTSGRYGLYSDQNRALSAWQRDHLRVSWAVVPDPWRFEANVIVAMSPPMNRAHNARHSFYRQMGAARDRFRAAAESR